MKSNHLNIHLQDCIIHLAITSSEFLRLIRPALKPNLIGNRYSELALSSCYDYWDRFRDAPKDHFHDEFVARTSSLPESERNMMVEYILKIRAMSKPDIEYVLHRLNEFVRKQSLSQAAIQFAELLEQDDVSEAETLMHEALRSGIDRVNIGLDYLNAKVPLRENKEFSRFLMNTGIKELDRIIKGFKRGQLVVWFGQMKGGKTWALGNLGKTALLHGLNVVHISHEMDEEELENRYDMSLAAAVDEDNLDSKIVEYQRLEDSEYETISVNRPSLTQWQNMIKKRGIVKRFGGRLFIKKYPMYSADMMEIDRYLHQLERSEGLSIDVVINDYVDIMKPMNEKEDLRHQINHSYMYHKRIADERQCLVVTASQIPKVAFDKAILGIKDAAEDVRKTANMDLGIFIAQTPQMAQMNTAALYVVNRAGPAGHCLVGVVFEMGQFALWSAPGVEIPK